MKPTRRGFLKIMVAGVVVATVPIPMLPQGVVAKPWPVGEPRIVYFIFELVMAPRPEGAAGLEYDLAKDVVEQINHELGFEELPTGTRILTSTIVSSQEEMDTIEQTEAFVKWFPARHMQLERMMETEPEWRLAT